MATIRHARRDDIPAVLDMIRELADYEHALDRVKATEETLLDTIAVASSDGQKSEAGLPVTEPISPQKPARCLVLINEKSETVGMALYFYNYSTWRARPGIYLEDLYVRQTERKKGFGRRLLVELAKEAVAMNAGRLDWSVLKWNQPSIDFYESPAIGAKMQSEWVGMRVEGEGLVKLATSLD